MCKKPSITFYNIIRFHFNKKIKNCPKPEASRSFWPEGKRSSQNSGPMVSSGIYFAGFEILPCKLASAQNTCG